MIQYPCSGVEAIEIGLSICLSDVQSSHLVQHIGIKQNPKWGNVYWLLLCCKSDYWVLVSIKWCDLNLQLKFICVLSNRVKYVCGLHSWKTSDLFCQCQTAILLLTSSEFLVPQVLTVMSATCEHGLYHDGQLVSALRMACMTDLHRAHAIADRIVVFGWGSVMVCRACSPDLHPIEHLQD